MVILSYIIIYIILLCVQSTHSIRVCANSIRNLHIFTFFLVDRRRNGRLNSAGQVHIFQFS